MVTTSLYISYAYMHCNQELVRKTFSTILGGDYIETIHQKVKKYNHGKPHRTFQICFKENTHGIQEIIDRIYFENFSVTFKDNCSSQTFFKKWANPGRFFFYFRLFKHFTIFTTNMYVKKSYAHSVYGAGI